MIQHNLTKKELKQVQTGLLMLLVQESDNLSWRSTYNKPFKKQREKVKKIAKLYTKFGGNGGSFWWKV